MPWEVGEHFCFSKLYCNLNERTNTETRLLLPRLAVHSGPEILTLFHYFDMWHKILKGQ
jgi:hypothetical protein